jgi:hypothetical protein
MRNPSFYTILEVTAALVIKLVVMVGLELALVPLAAALFLAEGLGAIRLVRHLRLRGETDATVGPAKLGHGCSPVS